MLRLLFIIGLILLICPPLNAVSIITNQEVETLKKPTNIQFTKKHAIDNINDEGYALLLIPSIICYSCEDKTIAGNMRFLLKIHYIRVDEDHAPARFINDRQWFIRYVGSIEDDEVHFFEIEIYQWIKYMMKGFDGFIYFKNKRKVDFKIPAHVFTDLNEAYESWKK